MTTSVFIGYLMLRDASFSYRKREVAEFFLEFALPEVRMKHDLILNDIRSLLANHDLILEGSN